MKNSEILILVNNGILAAKYATIDGAHAYKMFKFRKEISKALTAFTESYKELLKSNDIEDIDAFNKRIEELRAIEKPTKEEEAELKASLEKLDKVEEMFKSLLEDDVTLDCKPMPFSEYHKLWLENRPKDGKMSLFEYENVIDMLEGVLWHPDE